MTRIDIPGLAANERGYEHDGKKFAMRVVREAITDTSVQIRVSARMTTPTGLTVEVAGTQIQTTAHLITVDSPGVDGGMTLDEALDDAAGMMFRRLGGREAAAAAWADIPEGDE